jgi:isopentenyl phosphate kinase
VHRVIHVTEVEGVLDSAGKVIPNISRSNSADAKKHINGTKGYDVTGGMWHKIEESLQLADKGIQSFIIYGMLERNLYNCLVGKKFIGTVIE